jgi:hypothetical protein
MLTHAYMHACMHEAEIYLLPLARNNLVCPSTSLLLDGDDVDDYSMHELRPSPIE